MASIEQLELDLPNGFHDARLCWVKVDYERAEVVMGIDTDVSDPDASAKPQYRHGELHITGVAFFSMDRPESVSEPKPLWLAAGRDYPLSKPRRGRKASGVAPKPGARRARKQTGGPVRRAG